MPRGETADVVIAGAGCAGLSLAVHLVQAGITDRRILLTDPRTAYGRDRTWCFWDTGRPMPFDGAVTHDWNQWRVAGIGEEVIQQSSRFMYRHIPAHRFYETAHEILRGFANVEIRLGCGVETLRDEGESVRVGTDSGDVMAGVVFDSRPCAHRRTGRISGSSAPGENAISLMQHFLGVRVKADRDVFDPATATLMDFRVSQQSGIHFLYILPFSRREALLETTYISTGRLTRDDYLASLKEYCATNYPGTAFSLLGEEAGVIPMRAGTLASRHRKPVRVITAGVAGGMVKPSTGYAFLSIQRWSEEIARQMAQGVEVPLSPAPRSRRAVLMDRVFLSYLRAHPAETPALFVRLFRQTPTDRLVRFLSDAGTLGDDIAVVRALPKVAFMKQASHEITESRLVSLQRRTA